MVTVIIPNYNHAKYLPQRIESILNQSYTNFEIIILDDCSTDDSREIIDRYKYVDSRISIVFNEENSGSTFVQWNRGFALAKGEYIWLAESDDYAHPKFLESLVGVMENKSNIGLAYCDSVVVDEESNYLTEIKYILDEHIKVDIWNESFYMNGSDFVKRYMSFTNVIPNASAVLLRKSVINDIGLADASMRLAGDWIYWSKILSISDIFYNHESLNYFRKHTNNVRSSTLKNGVLLVETSMVMKSIRDLFPNEAYDKNALGLFFDNWIADYRAGNIPLSKNITIAQNIGSILGGKHILFNKFFGWIFKDTTRVVKTFFKIK